MRLQEARVYGVSQLLPFLNSKSLQLPLHPSRGKLPGTNYSMPATGVAGVVWENYQSPKHPWAVIMKSLLLYL